MRNFIKLKEFSKEFVRNLSSCFGGALWKGLIGFQGLIGVLSCLDKR